MTEHKNIHEAINAVMDEVGYVKKTKSQNLNYTFAGESALIQALRPSLVEHGIYMSVKEIHDVVRDSYTTKSGTAMVNTIIRATLRFVHAPTGTELEVASVGEGSDAGDKSANKAMTGLYKYALRQTFCIETGDDPDKNKSEARAEKPAPPKQEVTIKVDEKKVEQNGDLRKKHAEVWKQANSAGLLTKDNVKVWSISASDDDKAVEGKIALILSAIPAKAGA